MKIEKDIVTFDAADFAGLSDYAKKAVSVYLEDYAAYFSVKVNKEIELSKAHLKTLTIAEPTTDSILVGLAAADEAKRLEVEPLLNQLDALLNPEAAQPESPAEAQIAEAQPQQLETSEATPSLLERVKSFFS